MQKNGKVQKKVYIDHTVGDPFSSSGIAHVYDFIRTYACRTGLKYLPVSFIALQKWKLACWHSYPTEENGAIRETSQKEFCVVYLVRSSAQKDAVLLQISFTAKKEKQQSNILLSLKLYLYMLFSVDQRQHSL